jgi:hypothetical protein
VPDSCIVHDFNNTKSGSVYAERELGISILAQICPQKQALTAIEGVVYNCKQSDTNVYVIRYLNLGINRNYLTSETQATLYQMIS